MTGKYVVLCGALCQAVINSVQAAESVDIFSTLDSNGDGVIDKQEWHLGTSNLVSNLCETPTAPEGTSCKKSDKADDALSILQVGANVSDRAKQETSSYCPGHCEQAECFGCVRRSGNLADGSQGEMQVTQQSNYVDVRCPLIWKSNAYMNIPNAHGYRGFNRQGDINFETNANWHKITGIRLACEPMFPSLAANLYESSGSTLAYYCPNGYNAYTMGLRGTIHIPGGIPWYHIANLPERTYGATVRPKTSSTHITVSGIDGSQGAWNGAGWSSDMRVYKNGWVLVNAPVPQSDNPVNIDVQWPLDGCGCGFCEGTAAMQ